MANKINVCPWHLEYPVPLIYTFAFRGAEYWCPFCQYKSGILEAGEIVELTPELEKRHDLFKAAALPYINAVGTLNCDRIEYPRGSGITMPPNELPAEVLEENARIVATGWKSGIIIEDVKQES